MCKKHIEIVNETEASVIALVRTDADYYIDIFPKNQLDSLLLSSCHTPNAYENAIQNIDVTDMLYLCRHEDFCKELLDDAIGYILEWGENNA